MSRTSSSLVAEGRTRAHVVFGPGVRSARSRESRPGGDGFASDGVLRVDWMGSIWG